MRRHSLTHPTGPGSFGDAARQEPRQDRTEHPGLASPPAPPDPASRCPQPGVTNAATSGQAGCAGGLCPWPPSGSLWAQGTSPAALPGRTGRSCLAVPSTAEPAEPWSFGDSSQQGMGMKQGACRGLSVLHGWGVPCSFWGLSPPKLVPQAESPQGEWLGHTSITRVWDGAPSPGTPSCPRRPLRCWLPLNAGLSATKSTQPGRGAPRGAPTNQ